MPTTTTHCNHVFRFKEKKNISRCFPCLFFLSWEIEQLSSLSVFDLNFSINLFLSSECAVHWLVPLIEPILHISLFLVLFPSLSVFLFLHSSFSCFSFGFVLPFAKSTHVKYVINPNKLNDKIFFWVNRRCRVKNFLQMMAVDRLFSDWNFIKGMTTNFVYHGTYFHLVWHISNRQRKPYMAGTCLCRKYKNRIKLYTTGWNEKYLGRERNRHTIFSTVLKHNSFFLKYKGKKK